MTDNTSQAPAQMAANTPQTTQPGMMKITLPPGCLPGLQYLLHTSALWVQAMPKLLETVTSWNAANTYNIFDQNMQRIYVAQETSSTISRQFFNTHASFTMHVLDYLGQEVITCNRPTKVFFDDKIEVYAFGQPLGQVKRGSISAFNVLNAAGEAVLCIACTDPCVCDCCGSTIDFKVYLTDKVTEVGQISKQGQGPFTESFTNADLFGVRFNPNLDVKIKALLIGAVFIIDFTYFENKVSHNDHYHHHHHGFHHTSLF